MCITARFLKASHLQMLPDDERIPNFSLDPLTLPNVTQANSVPLCWSTKTTSHYVNRGQMSTHKVGQLGLAAPSTSYFVYCKVGVVSFQGPLYKLKCLGCQLRLTLGVSVREEGQFPGRPGQPPQELRLIAVRNTSGQQLGL